ncbi:MAG: arylsulfatase [Planctomycetes bacterium]|nr:arylsulfatase [Planctomycetota bacterium]
MSNAVYNRRAFLKIAGVAVGALGFSGCRESLRNSVCKKKKPNVIIIMTDDQGYGDLQSHGNPLIKTPAMDELRRQSVRFTDFHVAPKCTPTRGQLLTGIDAMYNGATRVCQGRSMVRRDIKLMPEFFAEAGYSTGMFGKWHLGDSYPHRPRFRGFQEVVSFRAWGITSLADYWGNSYYNPTLFHNGVDKKYNGYCTDIFFSEAMKWMEKCQSEKKPFFLYIPTNTPHVPEIVPARYSKPYKGVHKEIKVPDVFYGMITNIDENLGKLEQFLKEKGLRDNTILIFLSDNGTQNGRAQQIFNHGMRKRKGSVYEGGHRVPLFVRWIDGKLQHGKDIPEMTVVQDILPTLIELCDLKKSEKKINGVSLAGLVKGEKEKLKDRIVVTQFGPKAKKWKNTVVMWNEWRLIDGTQLYDISKDPGQKKNVFAHYPKISKRMTAHYDEWFKGAREIFNKPRYIIVGSDKEKSLTLYANDWQGGYCDNRGGLIRANSNGYWDLIVDQSGSYEVELRRWPQESKMAFTEAHEGKGARPIAKARLIINDFDETVDTKPEDSVVKFTVDLKAGNTRLQTYLMDENGKDLCGAMYVKVTRK